jgi:hypothetical protein
MLCWTLANKWIDLNEKETKVYLKMTSRFTYIVGRSSFHDVKRDRRGRDHIAVGFMTTYAISAYGHKSCEVESRQARCARYNIVW